MIAALFISFLAVFLGFLARYDKYKYSLELAMFLIAIFLGIRYMWGNDMPAYVKIFDDVNSIDIGLDDLLSLLDGERLEIGWIILNKLCSPFGFLSLQILLVIFQNYVVYRLIKENVNPKWYWFSLFIYCFNVNYMILSASMMRQYLSQCLFLLAGRYIIHKRIIPYFLLILLALSFHKSAFILFPFFLLGFFNYNFNYKHILCIGFILLIWLKYSAGILNDFLSNFIFKSEEFDRFDIYLGGEYEQGMGLGILFRIIFILTLLSQCHKFTKENKVYAILSSFSLIFIPLMTLSPLVSRLTMYFSFFSIACYPAMFEKMVGNNTLYLKIFLFIGFIFFTLFNFFNFFNSSVWFDAYYHYNTIFQQTY